MEIIRISRPFNLPPSSKRLINESRGQTVGIIHPLYLKVSCPEMVTNNFFLQRYLDSNDHETAYQGYIRALSSYMETSRFPVFIFVAGGMEAVTEGWLKGLNMANDCFWVSTKPGSPVPLDQRETNPWE